MQVLYFSLYDSVGEYFLPPFSAVSDTVAARAVKHALVDSQNDVSKSPQDFSLYRLATFDDSSGLFAPQDPPVFITRCNQLINANFTLPDEEACND